MYEVVNIKGGPELRKLVKKVYPDYSGRKYRLVIHETCRLHDTNWSGGTRSEYHTLHRDGRLDSYDIGAPWDNPIEGSEVVLDDSTIVMENAIFCGKHAGITIHIHPSVAPRLLRAYNT